MAENVEIARAFVDDLSAVAKLNCEVQDLHNKAHPEIFHQTDPQAISDFLSQIMPEDKHIFYVAKLDSNIVGYMIIKIIERPENPFIRSLRELHIEHIGVNESFHGLGIGKALTEKAKEVALRMQCDLVKLEVHTFNKEAIRFYERQGFETSSHKMQLRFP